MEESNILWREVLAGGGTWSHVLKRGTALRITDTAGEANVGAYFLNAELPAERFNLPDTLKAQHTAKLTQGNVLLSDMGRILCSITKDSLGWHDPLAGSADAAEVAARYGTAAYQEHRNSFYRNARDGFVVELAKYGLGERDLQATINFFSKVQVQGDGTMLYVPHHSRPGSFVELRAEMNTLVLLNTCQHPLDPSPVYAPQAVELAISRVDTPAESDECFTFRPENTRAHILTERYFL